MHALLNDVSAAMYEHDFNAPCQLANVCNIRGPQAGLIRAFFFNEMLFYRPANEAVTAIRTNDNVPCNALPCGSNHCRVFPRFRLNGGDGCVVTDRAPFVFRKGSEIVG